MSPRQPSRLNLLLRDQDIADRCELNCETDYIDCTLDCNDTNCLVTCGRILNDCINGKCNQSLHAIEYHI